MFDGLPYVPPQRMFRRCQCGALVLKTKAGLTSSPPHRYAIEMEIP